MGKNHFLQSKPAQEKMKTMGLIQEESGICTTNKKDINKYGRDMPETRK